MYLIHDGTIIEAAAPIIKADNRGFRFGDGLFETMKCYNGNLLLAADHFERLWDGMHILSFHIPTHFTHSYIQEQVAVLCKKNGHDAARVRLTIYRGEEASTHYLIQTYELSKDQSLNQEGLVIGLYPDARKSIDRFSHLKTNNCLPYAMAALYAQEQKWNDCLLINTKENICESSISNVFIIKDRMISTPSLQEGCIAGVMRKKLLTKLPTLDYELKETALTIEMLCNADEVFLTNAMGIRWVKTFNNIIYSNKETIRIYEAWR